MIRQFTATAFVVHEGAVLLLWHKKLAKWLPPGGHVEENETPEEAAIRETKEETGIDIEIIDDPVVVVDVLNAKSMKRPFLCLLEEIPAHGDQPHHQHMDQIFLAKVKTLPKTLGPEECRWLKKEELLQLPKGELFDEAIYVIEKVFQSL